MFDQFIALHLTSLKDIALHLSSLKDLALHLTLLKDISLHFASIRDIDGTTIHFSECLDHYADMSSSSRHGLEKCESDCYK